MASGATVPSVEEIQSMTLEQLRDKLSELVHTISSKVRDRPDQVPLGASDDQESEQAIKNTRNAFIAKNVSNPVPCGDENEAEFKGRSGKFTTNMAARDRCWQPTLRTIQELDQDASWR